jgi:hypothetical protein
MVKRQTEASGGSVYVLPIGAVSLGSVPTFPAYNARGRISGEVVCEGPGNRDEEMVHVLWRYLSWDRQERTRRSIHVLSELRVVEENERWGVIR